MVEYPSFQKRLGAFVLDAIIVYAATLSISSLIWSLTFERAVALSVLTALAWPAYKVISQGVWGQTVGKRVAGICLRMDDGSPVRWSALFWRYAPALFHAVVYVGGWSMAAYAADWATLQSVSLVDRGQMIMAASPEWWGAPLQLLVGAWLVVNVIVMQYSSQKRALHDVIAGTTVRYV